MRIKYGKIRIGGESKTLYEWSRLSGVNYSTIWNRYKMGLRGRSLILPAFHSRLVSDAYTEDELYQLYRNFAGERNEQQRLADFAGTCNKCDVLPLLRKFRERLKKESGP